MTNKQIENYNRMRHALKMIAKDFGTTEWLQGNSEKEYGLEYEEALEMAYDNIQDVARQAVHGVREIKIS